jgi:lysozyme
LIVRTSDSGLSILKQFEGLRLNAYKDSVGVWTIGYGHTSMAGEPFVMAGLKITNQEAENILRRDVVKYERAVESKLTRVPNQNQFDAMVSLCYNVGGGNFAKSSVLRFFNAGQDAKAANAFLAWNKAGGRVFAGLTRRRGAEMELYMKPAQAQNPVVAPTTPKPQETAPSVIPVAINTNKTDIAMTPALPWWKRLFSKKPA